MTTPEKTTTELASLSAGQLAQEIQDLPEFISGQNLLAVEPFILEIAERYSEDEVFTEDLLDQAIELYLCILASEITTPSNRGAIPATTISLRNATYLNPILKKLFEDRGVTMAEFTSRVEKKLTR